MMVPIKYNYCRSDHDRRARTHTRGAGLHLNYCNATIYMHNITMYNEMHAHSGGGKRRLRTIL